MAARGDRTPVKAPAARLLLHHGPGSTFIGQAYEAQPPIKTGRAILRNLRPGKIGFVCQEVATGWF